MVPSSLNIVIAVITFFFIYVLWSFEILSKLYNQADI